MWMDLFSNKKIWTIIFILVLLFTIVSGLRYMGLYEGMETASTVTPPAAPAAPATPAAPAAPATPAAPAAPAASTATPPAAPAGHESKSQQIASTYNF